MKIQLGRTWQFTWELGTIGLKNKKTGWYGDVFLSGPALGLRPKLRRFINDGVAIRRWETLTRRGWRIDRMEVLNAENAARIFRRTMKPYVLLTDRHTGYMVEAMSYPCPNLDGTVTIMVRTRIEDPSSLIEARCENYDPVSFVATGVPAENPLPII